jgi:flagellar biosynthesis chaperone FliJ
MDKTFKKEQFQTIKIKTSVVKKFRRFSKKMSQSQSMTLLLMLDFFEHNGVSPNETLGPQIQTLENLIKKRINGVIAIMKDIEKIKQNLPLPCYRLYLNKLRKKTRHC